MPAPIIGSLTTYLGQQLNADVWDGETPRRNAAGTPIYPASGTTVVQLTMPEQGFEREWTTEDPYTDKGTILIRVWGVSRAQVEGVLNQVEALLARAQNWATVSQTLGNNPQGGDPSNPYAIIQMLLTRWASTQEEGERTPLSELRYKGELEYEVMIHGAIATL